MNNLYKISQYYNPPYCLFITIINKENNDVIKFDMICNTIKSLPNNIQQIAKYNKNIYKYINNFSKNNTLNFIIGFYHNNSLICEYYDSITIYELKKIFD
jgi:hypothetical protein